MSWLRLAEQDLVAARVLLTDPSAANRIACFLAQQAAEKALKAGLISLDESFPKIHGLTELLGRFPDGRRPAVDPDHLDVLDPWVLDGRYAADLPEVAPHEAEHVIELAGGVVDACRRLVT
jgi:HEPN domain-containing protein